jgi:L-ascorbate metabolism protein UlaG (beta-lactamase superfamily)
MPRSSAWYRDGRYHNLDGFRIPPRNPVKRFLRWKFGDRPPPELHGALDEPAVPVEPDRTRFDAPHALQVTWLGHATVLIQLGGTHILTDPTFGRLAFGTVQRLMPPPVLPADLPHIDVIAVSHNHYDHCDLPSIKAVRRRFPEAVLAVPSGLDHWMRRRFGDPVQRIEWWHSVEIGGVHIHAVPAQHWSVRGPGDECQTHWCGFVFESAVGTVYFAGDTGFGLHFEAIAERHPRIDAALLPVGAYAPRWFMQHQHIGPQEAVEAANILGARILPMHWGTYKLTDEPLDEPPRLAREEATRRNVPITLLHPGGIWSPELVTGAWLWSGDREGG